MTKDDDGLLQWYMVTVVGNDRPGIVARLTRILFEADCNLGEASMIRLGGNFTIMMMVASNQDVTELQNAMAPVAGELALRVHIDLIEAHLHKHIEPDIQISVHGADRSGIVAEVTGALAEAGLNILDLQSDVGGTEDKPVYIMMIDGYASQGVEKLEKSLSELKDRGIEARLTPLETLVG